MKKKRILALVLAMMFALTVLMPTTVAASTDMTLSMPGNTYGYTYSAYRILDVNPSGAYSINSAFTAFEADSLFTSLDGYVAGPPMSLEAYIRANNGNAQRMHDLMEALEDFIIASTGTITPVGTPAIGSATGPISIIDLPEGHYFIAARANAGGALNAGMSRMLTLSRIDNPGGTVTVTPKVESPTIVKEVLDTDANPTPEWDDETTAKIGDEVDFRLTITVPNLAPFIAASASFNYTLVVTDTLSAGLSLASGFDSGDVTITAVPDVSNPPITGGTPAGGDYQVAVNTSTNTLTITFTPSFILNNGGREYTIEYSATLNEDAVIGSAGNPNTVVLEYSNDPLDDGKTNSTPPTTATVYTFEFDIFKFFVHDTNGNTELPGAQFNLYNTPAEPVTSGTNPDTPLSFTSVAASGPAVYTDPTVYTHTNSTGSATIISPSSGLMTIQGLGAGTYWLVETQAPAGYALLAAPIEITIVHVDDGDHTITATINGTTGPLRQAGTPPRNILDVLNDQGNLLPETGGMGRTVLYTAGCMLMGSASLMFVYRKKTAKEN
jgi:fimbrial isopeptide formation D2 family protein/LPXTG-motif cell wall-anchored protein